MKKLLTVTAVLEFATGVSLLAAPSFLAQLLLGAGLESPVAVLLGRIAGAALLSLGLTCWLDRNRSLSGPVGLAGGLTVYNALGAALLAYGGLAEAMNGVALWPACLAHVALLIWCARYVLAVDRPSHTQIESSR